MLHQSLNSLFFEKALPLSCALVLERIGYHLETKSWPDKIPLFVEDAINNTAMEVKMRVQRFTKPLQECHRAQPAATGKIGAI